MDKTWKAFERRVARRLGTERIPAAADPSRNAPDFATPCFAYQAKKGYKMPAYLRGWLQGILSTANERTGVVIWAAKGDKDDDAVVVMRFSDWERIAAALERRSSPVVWRAD